MLIRDCVHLHSFANCRLFDVLNFDFGKIKVFIELL